MNYLNRYLNGEHQQVWKELVALRSAVRRPQHIDQAQAVATETMRRVRTNCERIIARLQSSEYSFGVYPDGSRGYFSDGALISPSSQSLAHIATLEEHVGTIPLSLSAFWREVGSVDLVGMHPNWPTLLDPLVVYPPEVALDDLESWRENEQETFSEPFEVGLAPDSLHKDNISGGEPYSVRLPSRSADFIFRYERHRLHFVAYLRLAILKWGGFPGLERQRKPLPELRELIADLEPF